MFKAGGWNSSTRTGRNEEKECGFVDKEKMIGMMVDRYEQFVLSERIISPTTWLHQLPVIQSVHDMLIANGFSLQVAIAYEED